MNEISQLYFLGKLCLNLALECLCVFERDMCEI